MSVCGGVMGGMGAVRMCAVAGRMGVVRVYGGGVGRDNAAVSHDKESPVVLDISPNPCPVCLPPPPRAPPLPAGAAPHT